MADFLNLQLFLRPFCILEDMKDLHILSDPVKRGFRGSLRSDFDKTIDKSNVNGFSWNCFH